MDLKKGTLVGLYVRVSTQEQAREGYSIGEQTERLKAYAAAMGWTVQGIYTDPGFSGGTMDRPGLQNLLQNLDKMQKVVVYKLDRLSRSQLDTLYLIEKRFLAGGVDFVSVCENFDTGSPFGRAMIGILAVFAQLEREQIKERMTLGKEARAKEGKFMSGNAPVGYELVDGRLVVNEYEADLVRRVFAEYIGGKSFKGIAKALNAEGLSHKKGEWNDVTVRYVLQSRVYLGENRWRGEWIKGDHEPLITPQIFDTANHKTKVSHQRFEAEHREGRVTLLGGLLTCGNCGGPVFLRSQKRGYRYYRCVNAACKCKPSWKQDRLTEIVLSQVRGLRYEKPNPAPSREKGKKAEAQKLRDQLARLLDLYAEGRFPVETLNARVDKINAAILALEKEEPPTLKQERERLGDFSEILDSGDAERIRSLLVSLIDHIELTREDVTFYWRFV